MLIDVFGLVLEAAMGSGGGGAAKYAKILRIVRMVRLVRAFKMLKVTMGAGVWEEGQEGAREGGAVERFIFFLVLTLLRTLGLILP